MRIKEKRQAEKPARKARRKLPEAKHNVVSLRMNDQEKRLLDRFTEANRKNISDVVREALQLWQAKNRRLVLPCRFREPSA